MIKRKSIQFRIILHSFIQIFFVSLFIVAVGLILFAIISSKNLDYNSQEFLKSFEQTISFWLEDAKRTVEGLAELPAIKEMRWDSARPYLETLTQHESSSFFMYFLADTTGHYHTIEQLDAGSVGDRAYFQAALQGEVTISIPVISRSTGKNICVVAAPVYDNSRKIVGVFAGNIELNVFSDWMRKFILDDENSYSYIIDSDGLIVSHPNNDLIRRFNVYSFLNMNSKNQATVLRSNYSGKISYKHENMKSYAYFTTIKGTAGWKVITKVSFSYILSPFFHVLNIFMIVSLLCILFSILTGYFLAKSIAQPVLDFRDSIKKASVSQKDINIEIHTDDEIGELAKYFNKLMETKKQIHTELLEANTSLKEYLDSLTTYTAKLSVDGEILTANKPMVESLIIRSSLSHSVKFWDAIVFGKELYNKNLVIGLFEKACKGNLSMGEVNFHKFDNRQSYLEFTFCPVFANDNNLSYIIFEARDVTEKNMLEAQLINMKKLESIGVLAGGIAHDFNNILTGILGMISLAKLEVESNYGVYQKLVNAEKSTLKAKDLTRQLLTFSKGGAPLKKSSDVSVIVDEAINFALSGSNIEIIIHQPKTLSLVDIDEGQIHQVISNIAINARHAMPNGGKLTVSIEMINIAHEMSGLLDAGEYIKIEMSDTGEGMPHEVISQIFDPYFSTKKDGNGLGLAISFSIIQKHDGIITVNSELNKGTSFTIYLPVFQKNDIVTAVKKAKPIVEINHNFQLGKRILLMDDDETVLGVLGEILKLHGYEVVVTRNSEEALNLKVDPKGEGAMFSVAILDLTIPGGAGAKEVVYSLKEQYPEIKTIVTSGYAHDPVVLAPLNYGFDAALIKPFVAEEVYKVINNLLQ